MEKLNRILDANVNRVSEGIRVIEDVCRFYFEDEEKTERLRNSRHKLRKTFAKQDRDFIKSRDSLHDIGLNITANSTLDKKSSLYQVITANCKRVTEGLRTIEETAKIVDLYKESKVAESIRYDFYHIEKSLHFMFKKEIPQGIYGITCEKFSNGKDNVEQVKDMIAAGIKIIQYREKYKSIKIRYEECMQITKLCKESGVLFIVNDNIDIAVLVDADGVHIGQDDLPVEMVRTLIGEDKIIGLSTHSPDQAKEAIEKGVDYIGVGPIFKTYTKDNVCDPVGVEYLEYIVNNTEIPFIAIGGIKENNLNEIVSRGATRVAMVSEIVGAEDVNKKVDIINNILNNK